ncbi:hypothetical protein [Rubellimicrobium aerolatum]|uniref:Uncharacterized protein n=1 Tax=Rubellimicrobium aerolatum TaxID=490979 RepID=A0ABW0SBT7_9RHOB|nr:hypothetical protein [Rubellimicrobium aerolatum]MBP1805880.1 hypothetical protein [Rubellimicrobium aerolatum]
MTFSRPALALLAIGLAGAAYALRRTPSRSSGTKSPYQPVRNAGREEMTLPMRRWDKVDEALDETFPASDPVTTY